MIIFRSRAESGRRLPCPEGEPGLSQRFRSRAWYAIFGWEEKQLLFGKNEYRMEAYATLLSGASSAAYALDPALRDSKTGKDRDFHGVQDQPESDSRCKFTGQH